MLDEHHEKWLARAMKGTASYVPISHEFNRADSDRHLDCDTRQTFVDSRTTVHISLFPVFDTNPSLGHL